MKSLIDIFSTASSSLAIFLISSMVSVASAESFRNPDEYNLVNGIGLHGYDPVAIFPEGGGGPLKGSENIQLDYEGVTYYFASTENRRTFGQNPAKYEPTYGGWCAYAMSFGEKVDVQPDIYSLSGNRAHYFVSTRAKRNFDNDIHGHESRADEYWKTISGEGPRR